MHLLPRSDAHQRVMVSFLSWAICFLASTVALADDTVDPAALLKGLPLVSGSGTPSSAGGGTAGALGGGGAAVSVISYSISGHVRTPSNAAVAGVVMSGLPGSPRTGADGSYSAEVPSHWSGDVEPAKMNWQFAPGNRLYTDVTANLPTQDYVAEGIGGARVHVDVDHAGVEDGLSWETAFNTIQEGIDAAFEAGGGDVWVAGGTYTSTMDPVVTLREYVDVYGGFFGDETDFFDRSIALYPGIIDGQGARRCVVGANSSSIDGFNILGGHAEAGAGMYNNAASPEVVSCLFVQNAADGLAATLPLLEGGNASPGGGGAAAPSAGGAAQGIVEYGTGGAIHNTNAAPSIVNCVFLGNTASEGGGAICNSASSPTLSNCLFLQNAAGQAEDSPPQGQLQSLQLVAGTVGGGGGGGVAAGNAGGIADSIPGYSAGLGGAVLNHLSDATIVNCTFTENASLEGGAIFNSSSLPTVMNVIAWNDLPNEIVNTLDSTPDVTYSDVMDGYAGEGNIAADPLFLDPPEGDFRLSDGSPCIDTGTNEGAPSVDLWWVPRPQGSGVDMGAFER